jgi:hypothetical protein
MVVTGPKTLADYLAVENNNKYAWKSVIAPIGWNKIKTTSSAK